MAILKLIVFGCILAVTLAVSLEPILPTPAPSDSALRNETKENSVENEMTTLNPSVKPAILIVKGSTDNVTSTAKNDDNDIKQGRAMNISSTDAQSFSNSINNSSKGESKAKARHLALNPDLSDVSMDGDDMDLEFSGNSPGKENSSKGNIFGETRVVNKPHIDASDKSFMPLLMPSISSEKDVIETSCIDSGKIYKVGESIQRGCEETCTCMPEGRLSCEARCRGPYFRRGRKIDDPLCAEKEVEDPCCSILVCAADTGNTMCVSGNKTYMAGENFNEGCERTCRCESGGNISCVPRCPILEQRDDCFSVPNSNDSCCMLQLCDVTPDNEEDSNPSNRDAKQKNDLMSTVLETTTNKMSKENATTTLPVLPDVINTSKKPIINSSMTSGMVFIPISKDVEPILSTYRLSNGSVQVVLRQSDQPIQLEISNDESATYKDIKLNNGMLTNLESGHDYIVRSKQTKKEFHITIPKMDDAIQDGCMHRGKHRSIDEEFHMGCDELCVCGTNGKVKCATLQCPSTVGLDVLDPHCIKWSPDPPDFVPTYPMCCPPAMKCISNGSCTYKEHVLPNWSEVPKELSGCEQQCFCEQGMIECQSVCAPLTATPPPSLNCPPSTHPAPQLIHDDSCCKEWACVNAGKGLSPFIQNKTDSDTDKSHNFYGQNDTDKNNLLPPPIFVTLPPDLHKAIQETFGSPIFSDRNKIDKLKEGKSSVAGNKKEVNSPFHPYPSVSVKSEKDEIGKHYDYPGPFADPNHQPPPPINGLDSFPFIKKHKEKQIYSYNPEVPTDSIHYINDVGTATKDNPKKSPNQNHTENALNKHYKTPLNQDEYPINDPYLSSSPLHVPFNQNGVGPGFFNPSTSKNQHDYLNVLQSPNGNSNSINPLLIPPGNGVYHNGHPIGNQVPQGPETIHVYTDGSPIHIEHLLQHIQQADPSVGSYIPFVTQPHQTNIPNNHQLSNENNTSNNAHPGLGSFPITQSGPSFGNGGNEELQVLVLEPISPTEIRLVFSLPAVMVGLQGRVKLRYTDSNDPDEKYWKEQEFAPRNDLLASQQLEFQLGSLQPNTLYHIQATVVFIQFHYERKSRIYSVRTLPAQEQTTLPSTIPIEPNLAVGQVNPTSVQITWRPFTQDELLYIDGIQLRYREIDGKVFSGTPLIHRAVTSFLLESLKPNTSYEVGIYFIPFLGQHTELQSTNMYRFNTTPQTDMFDWNVSIEVENITPWSLTIKWTGVPRPAERYVHVYRTIWRAEAARIDASSFSLPARDALSETNITGLTPGTKYGIWLELYLTNGRTKTSNVKDIMTKPGKPIPEDVQKYEGKVLEASPHRGDYYSSLVVVAILAALGAMCSLVLLLVLVRRHRTASAPICGPTSASRTSPALPPYDSPTYKLDLHQETMDL